MRILKIALFPLFTLLWSSGAIALESLPEVDFSNFRVFGVSSPAIHSQDEAIAWIRKQRQYDDKLDVIARSELIRYLTYNLLSQYSAFMMRFADKPDQSYLDKLEPLKQELGEESFNQFLTIANNQATVLAKKIRYSLTLVRLATKHLQNRDDNIQKVDIQNEINMLTSRLLDVSRLLIEEYPESRGELPPVVIAFAASFFNFESESLTVSCANPIPSQMKSQVLAALEEPSATDFPQQSPLLQPGPVTPPLILR